MPMSRRRGLSAGVILTVLAGCTDPASGPLEPRIQPSATFARQATAALAVGEREFAELASQDSTFAGFYLEGDTLVALTNRAARAGAIADIMRRRRSEMGEAGSVRGGLRPVVVRSVDYSYGALSDWRARIMEMIPSNPDIIGLDLDEYRNRVTVRIVNAASESAIREGLATRGVPLEAVEFEVRQSPDLEVHLDDYQRPLQGGFRLATAAAGGVPIGYCTYGFNARINGTAVFVTNSHCTASMFSATGSIAYQNDHFGSPIGTEWLDPAPNCPSPFTNCRYSDAAAFTHASSNYDFGRIARTQYRVTNGGTGSLTIDSSKPVFNITSEMANPPVGTVVNAMGQNSGWTYGVVWDTCGIQYFSNFSVWIFCVSEASYTGVSGDSGSPIFYWYGNDNIALAGLHLGGDDPEVFSPLSMLEYDLGNLDVIYQPPPPPLTVSISGPLVVTSAGNKTFTANPSGGSSYTYYWEYKEGQTSTWYHVGTQQTYATYVSAVDAPYFDLRVTVTSGGNQAVDTHHVLVEIDGGGGCSPCEE